MTNHNAIDSGHYAACKVPSILRDGPPKKNGFRAAIFMMQKNEDEHLRPWLEYHSFLFGAENLYVWDNGSTSGRCLSILQEYERLGTKVDYSRTTGVDFRRKGVMMGETIKELDKSGCYDFYFPLDCDEFLAVETSPGNIRCDSAAIAKEFAGLKGEERALSVQWAYYNVLGHKDYFWRLPHPKTFFGFNTFKYMDHGYHVGEAKAEGRRESRFVYIHYHYKPHAVIVEHSKAKLRPTVDIDNPEILQAEYKKGNRLAKFILESEEVYMQKFKTDNALYMPRVENFFEAIGSRAPLRTVVAGSAASDPKTAGNVPSAAPNDPNVAGQGMKWRLPSLSW